MQVTFDSGLTVVYKPRSVATGASFHQVVDRLDEQVELGFRTPAFLPRDGYGWMEWVDSAECDGPEAVERYYRRTGGLIALAYLLGFSDCQIENVIPAGEYPTIVDGETLLHPFIKGDHLPYAAGVGDLWTDSVFLTNLVPIHLGTQDNVEGGQFGELMAGFPLSAEEKKVTGREFPTVDAPNTDVMAVDFETATMDPSENLPSIDGTPQPPDEYIDPMVEGFETVYESVLEFRDDGRLSEVFGIPDAFTDLENRIVFRPTARYFEILKSIESRSCLRDGARWGIELEELAAPMFVDGDTNPMWPLYEAELAALNQYEVPRFTARTDGERIELRGRDTGVAADSAGIDRCRDRIASADRSDMNQQIEIVRGSYGGTAAPDLATLELGERRTVDNERLLAESRTIFDHIEEAAIDTDDGYGWVSTKLDEHREQPVLTFLHDDESLYSGCTGIAVFGAALYRLTGDERYREFAREAVEPTLASLTSDWPPQSTYRLGGASGVGSFAYCLGVVGELLDRPDIVKQTTITRHLTTELIESDDTYDVIGGSAGTILGLLGLYDRVGGPDLLSWAEECGDHLLKNRVAADGGQAWMTIDDTGDPHTGFSHGAAGIAYALTRLWDVTGSDKFRDAALEAVAYENEKYEPKVGNWISKNDSTKWQNLPDQWCWGRSGIGMARLGMAKYLEDDPVTDGLEYALDTFPTEGLDATHHLCCGEAGRAEFILEVEEQLGRRTGEARDMLGGVLAQKEAAGTYRTNECTRYLPEPSLFRGEAGIGYAMLRVVEPESLPCLLLWE